MSHDPLFSCRSPEHLVNTEGVANMVHKSEFSQNTFVGLFLRFKKNDSPVNIFLVRLKLW